MTKIFCGNWKTVLDLQTAQDIAKCLPKENNEHQIFFPSVESLAYLAINYPQINWGAQTISSQNGSSYTGEVSCSNLEHLHVNYCLIGHSERRKYFYEEALIKNKIQNAKTLGMQIIFCVGEEDGADFHTVVQEQLKVLTDDKVWIAYEPVWAIGTGKTATYEQIDQAVSWLKQYYDTVLYGGSVNQHNIAEILPYADGVLVGGASTKQSELEHMLSIIRE